MNITQKLVAEVKRHNKISWHDQAWHDFQALPEVEAINFAIAVKSPDDTAFDIVENAKKTFNFIL